MKVAIKNLNSKNYFKFLFYLEGFFKLMLNIFNNSKYIFTNVKFTKGGSL
jgi:hypothetical protein